ncbi:MAG: hypothetical protein E6Q77_01495 [Rhizobium sp.]|nr:MAG: hypothetical protein E6Q77_01495 [Rhizobium sp.]
MVTSSSYDRSADIDGAISEFKPLARLSIVIVILASLGGLLYYNIDPARSSDSKVSLSKVYSSEPENKSTRDETKDQILAIMADIEALRQDNTYLRSEIETLTQENGILDRIIQHIRELQNSDQELIGLVGPASHQGQGIDGLNGDSVQSTVKHEIVTPKAEVQIKDAPIPTVKPEKAAVTDGEKASNGSPEAGQ